VHEFSCDTCSECDVDQNYENLLSYTSGSDQLRHQNELFFALELAVLPHFEVHDVQDVLMLQKLQLSQCFNELHLAISARIF
jgi:hypothetical protein